MQKHLSNGVQSVLDMVWEFSLKDFWFQVNNFLTTLQATIIGYLFLCK